MSPGVPVRIRTRDVPPTKKWGRERFPTSGPDVDVRAACPGRVSQPKNIVSKLLEGKPIIRTGYAIQERPPSVRRCPVNLCVSAGDRHCRMCTSSIPKSRPGEFPAARIRYSTRLADPTCHARIPNHQIPAGPRAQPHNSLRRSPVRGGPAIQTETRRSWTPGFESPVPVFPPPNPASPREARRVNRSRDREDIPGRSLP